MAGSPVQRTVVSAGGWIMIRTDWIAGTQLQSFQRRPQHHPEPVGNLDQTSERSLRAGRSGINPQPATHRTVLRGRRQSINTLFERTRGITAIESNFAHQSVRQTVQKRVRDAAWLWRQSAPTY